MTLLHILEVQNTQNKIWNTVRRTYIDEGDCKEGEDICRKCNGVGEVKTEIAAGGLHMPETCPQCVGRGIVDWVTQAVERPPLMTGGSSSSSCSSSGLGMNGTSGVSLYHKGVKLLETHSDGLKIFTPRPVTNYKRRKVV